jgi:hypothetical protein
VLIVACDRGQVGGEEDEVASRLQIRCCENEGHYRHLIATEYYNILNKQTQLLIRNEKMQNKLFITYVAME